MDSRQIPQADMLAVSRSSRFQRKSILKYAPPIALSCVNYGDLGEVDNWFLECQNYRDYYRDAEHKVHRPQLFCQPIGKCGILPDRSVNMLLGPVNWVKERQPVVYLEKYNNRMKLDGRIRIGAHFQPNTSIVYTR